MLSVFEYSVFECQVLELFFDNFGLIESRCRLDNSPSTLHLTSTFATPLLFLLVGED